MANIDNTTLWSDNPAKFDEVTRNLEFERQRDIYREPGKIYLETAWGVPRDEIKALSAQHPDITFYAQHSFEHSWHDTIYTVEYKAGEKEKVIKAEPSYIMPIMDEIAKQVPCYEELEKKLIEVFERLDVEVTDDDGNKAINWADAEVTATVEHDGYKMQAFKYHSMVEELKVYKARKVETTEWEEVGVEDSDLPF